MGDAASELGFMHSGAIVEGKVFARIIACVVLSSVYVLKIANKRGYPSSFCLCDGKFGCESMTVSSKLTSPLILLFKVYLRRKNEYKKDTSLVTPQAIDGLKVDRNVFIQ